MADDAQEVNDIIDSLGDSPTPLEVYQATRQYDTRYLAAAAAARGGGGGAGVVQSARVVIPHAQILTLPTTAVEVVTAPAAGSFLFPVAAMLVSHITVGYTAIEVDAQVAIQVDATFTAYPILDISAESFAAFLGILIGSVGDFTQAMTIKQSAPVTPTIMDTMPYSPGQDAAALDGAPLLLAVDNNNIDFEDGDPANTLTVTVLYTEVTI